MRGLLVVALLALSSTAHADKAKAMQFYKAGQTAYTLGDFATAVEKFKAAYGEHEAPEFLFNVAQAYRQLEDCKLAVFFYKRYLSAKPDAPNAAEIGGRIAELNKMCAEREAVRDRPPEGTTPPDGVGNTTDIPDSVDEPGTTTVVATPTDPARIGPRGILTTRAEAGATFMSMGDLDVPAQLAFRLGFGYPIDLGLIEVEPGALITFVTAPYDTGDAILFSALANAVVSYKALPGLSLRGEIGLGVQRFSGFEQGNPFIEGEMPSGAKTMLNVRVAAGADYHVGHNFVVTGTVFALSFSPAPDDFSEPIDNITRFDFTAGIGYRY